MSTTAAAAAAAERLEAVRITKMARINERTGGMDQKWG